MNKIVLTSLLVLGLVSCSPSTHNSSSSSFNNRATINILTSKDEKKFLSSFLNLDSYEYILNLDTEKEDDIVYDIVYRTSYNINPSEYVVNEQFSLYSTFSRECFSVDNNTYGYPTSNMGNIFVLLYDSSLLGENDIKSFENILSASERTNTKGYLGFNDGVNTNMFFTTDEGLGRNSISYTKTDNNVVYNCSWDSEIGVGIFEYITNLFSSYYKDGYIQIPSSDGLEPGLKEKYISWSLTHYSMLDEMIKVNSNLKLAKIPTFRYDGIDHNPVVFSVSQGYFVSSLSSSIDASKDVATMLVNDNTQKGRYDYLGVIPTSLALLNDTQFIDSMDENDKEILKQIDYSIPTNKAVEDSYYSVAREIGSVMFTGLDDCYDDYYDFLNEMINKLR